jgi:hypothetical protein
MEEKPMLRTLGMALAGMCLVSTLAMAQPTAPGQEMVCTKVDASGYCVEAKAQDDKVITVRVEGVKMSEKMTCVTSGTTTTCTKVTKTQ